MRKNALLMSSVENLSWKCAPLIAFAHCAVTGATLAQRFRYCIESYVVIMAQAPDPPNGLVEALACMPQFCSAGCTETVPFRRCLVVRFGGSVVRFGRTLGRSVVRSVVRLVVRSVVRSYASVVRSHARSCVWSYTWLVQFKHSFGCDFSR